MADHVYGTGSNSTSGANTTVHFYDAAGIKQANAVNIFQQFVDKKSMPTRSGKTFKISKFLHMYDRAPNASEFAAKGYLTSRSVDEVTASLAAAALAEGAGSVNQRTLQKVTIETSLARYGEMISYTDEVDMFSEDIMQVRYREELGALANSRHEDLIMNDMLATGTVLYSGAATSLGTVGSGVAADGSTDEEAKISYDLIRAATRKLVRNRGKKNTSIITGDVKVGTCPVPKSFYAIIGPEVKADLETATRGSTYEREYVYVPVHKYANANSLAEGEVGQMHEVRFIEAERMAIYEGSGATPPSGYAGGLATGTNGNFNVYPILFPTEGCFATVGLKGHDKIVFNSQAPSFITNENPYGTKGFFSYNFFYAGLITNEEALLKVLVAASA